MRLPGFMIIRNRFGDRKMPLAQRIQTQYNSLYEKLINELLSEWRTPQSDHKEPVIIEEAPSRDERANHLYVIWSAWESLTPIERSKMILQAYEKYRGRDLALSITLAMGLTPQEASKLNLEY